MKFLVATARISKGSYLFCQYGLKPHSATSKPARNIQLRYQHQLKKRVWCLDWNYRQNAPPPESHDWSRVDFSLEELSHQLQLLSKANVMRKIMLRIRQDRPSEINRIIKRRLIIDAQNEQKGIWESGPPTDMHPLKSDEEYNPTRDEGAMISGQRWEEEQEQNVEDETERDTERILKPGEDQDLDPDAETELDVEQKLSQRLSQLDIHEQRQQQESLNISEDLDQSSRFRLAVDLLHFQLYAAQYPLDVTFVLSTALKSENFSKLLSHPEIIERIRVKVSESGATWALPVYGTFIHQMANRNIPVPRVLILDAMLFAAEECAFSVFFNFWKVYVQFGYATPSKDDDDVLKLVRHLAFYCKKTGPTARAKSGLMEILYGIGSPEPEYMMRNYTLLNNLRHVRAWTGALQDCHASEQLWKEWKQTFSRYYKAERMTGLIQENVRLIKIFEIFVKAFFDLSCPVRAWQIIQSHGQYAFKRGSIRTIHKGEVVHVDRLLDGVWDRMLLNLRNKPEFSKGLRAAVKNYALRRLNRELKDIEGQFDLDWHSVGPADGDGYHVVSPKTDSREYEFPFHRLIESHSG